jgi:hypothetical protein
VPAAGAASWAAPPGRFAEGDNTVSIVRVGLAETKKFSEGYEAIFGKKSSEDSGPAKKRTRKARASGKKSPKKKGR